MYNYGDWVITKNGKVGVITQVLPENEYFVSFENYGKIMRVDEIVEWHGAW